MGKFLQVEQLTKNYGTQRGIQDVTMSIDEGEVFGFLGPNGAGKTTTMRTLMGLLKPTSGRATINDLDCWTQSTAVKRFVGYLPGEYSFDPTLTGAQIISYLGHLRGGIDQSYVRQLIERLDFDPGKRFRAYSRGNKQKIGLIQAFMHRPRLLMLDEPTSGLDPLNQQEFYKMVNEVQTDGRTVFISSHILPEVEHTCDRVAIIREGRLIQVNEVARLKELKQHDVEITFDTPASLDWFSQIPGLLNPTLALGGKQVHISLQGDLQEIIQIAAQHNATTILTHEPNLEEVFLRFYENDHTVATLK